jgi:hypothetical protein
MINTFIYDSQLKEIEQRPGRKHVFEGLKGYSGKLMTKLSK